MKIAVISDLHLGCGDRADHFGHDDTAFCRFLDHLEGEFEQIVLLGDIYETLSGALPGTAAQQLARARAAHPVLAHRFARPIYRYVHGNHDLVTARLEAAPESLVFEADGVRILFTHGHLADRLIRRARLVSETGVWLGGWITRAGLGSVRVALSRFEDRLRVDPDPSRCSFQQWARESARAVGADVVVTGHTHMGAHHDHGDVVYVNSGACCGGELSYAAIDTARGEIGVHRVG